MPSPDDVFAELEADRAVREAEIRLLDNATKRTLSDTEAAMMRRSAVVLTYANLEGFCHFALTSFISAVNSLKIECSSASYPIAAATLTKLFAALRDPNSKHPIFQRTLPEDAKLHLTAREAEFVEKVQAAFKLPVDIPETAIDLESNLKSVVLKKNLYKLGLDYLKADAEKETLDKLLGIRNAIAHGDRFKVPTPAEVQDYSSLAFRIMRFVQYEVYESLRQKTYLRAA